MHMDSAVLTSNREIEMTQAAEILHSSNNASGAMKTAEELTNQIDQDWEHEATLYTFEDGSVLVVSGPQLNAYDSMPDAREALEA
jgi:hypothetical protein